MGRKLIAAAAVLASTLAPAAQAEGPAAMQLEPSSAWNASFDEGRCRLSRMFGSAGEQHALVFEQSAPGAKFHMAVAGPATASINSGLPLRLGFGPTGPETEQVIVRERNPDFASILFLKDIDLKPGAAPDAAKGTDVSLSAWSNAIDTAAAAPFRSISFTQGDKKLVFATGPLAAPLGVLNECTSHILSTWGLDPEAHRTAQRAAELRDQMKLARSVQERYPLRSLREGRGGVVGATVLLDQSGAPTECKITDDSGDPSLNELVCEQLMKAQFDPALDAGGQPMKSYWTTRVTYRIAI